MGFGDSPTFRHVERDGNLNTVAIIGEVLGVHSFVYFAQPNTARNLNSKP